jgi:hypothetical protein
MKAERRHDLKTNSLIWSLQQIPETARKYQSQITLVIVLIALAVILVRYRMNAAQQRLSDAQASLSIASEDLQRMEWMAPSPGIDELIVMKEREEAYSEGLQKVDEVLQKAPDREEAMKAQALIIKGDFNFNMANFPELAGAATQPALQPPESLDSLLSNAFDAYTQVLQDYPDEKFAVVAAHFGLAAVAENRAAASEGKDASQWAAAKAQYQAIVDSNADAPYKNLATGRLQLLPQLQQPLTIDLPMAMELPATLPSSRRAK